VVLFLSVLLAAPWGSIAITSLIWGVIGLFGIGYALVVAQRIRSLADNDGILRI
jgi:hypothetical protein